MSMTVVVARNVSSRMRGLLASSLLEIGPGIYTGARINSAVRQRVWKVMQEWFPAETDASVVMIYDDPSVPCGQSVELLGVPPLDLVNVDGLVLARRPLAST